MILWGGISSILDVIAMKRHAYAIGSHTGLRTMFSADVLVLLLAGTVAVVALVACAGVAAADAGVVNNLFQKVNEVYDPD